MVQKYLSLLVLEEAGIETVSPVLMFSCSLVFSCVPVLCSNVLLFSCVCNTQHKVVQQLGRIVTLLEKHCASNVRQHDDLNAM